MKAPGVISAAALFLLLGVTVPAFAQDNHEQDATPAKQDDQAKPANQEEQAKPAKPEDQAKSEKREPEAKPAKQEEQAKPPKQQEQHAKSEKQEPQAKPVKQEKEAKPAQQGEQAKREEGGKAAGQQHAQRSAAEEQRQRSEPALRLSARSESRIPDDRFRSNFGPEHTFRIGSPRMVDGYSRFQYRGYWFGFVEPWPSDWYYTDDVYVDYIDGGYYLCNPSYPDSRVAITIVSG